MKFSVSRKNIKGKELQSVFTSEAVLSDKWIYQSLKAKLCKIQYHTVWPLAGKLPVNICSVQYFKLALMTQQSLEERKKNAEMSVGHSYLFMIHRSRAKAEYLMKLFHPRRVKSGPVAAGGGRFRLSRAQSSRQDLKRKVWLFEWFD